MISVLFARSDSHYKTLPDCDVWDIERDARKWPGGNVVIAHPPCRMWGRLRQFAKGRPDEKRLAIDAIRHVRTWGGILEHPAHSTLWDDKRLPKPGEGVDWFGGWSIEVCQFHWGHRAEKRTWFYISGIKPDQLPAIPVRSGRPTHCVRPTKSYPRLPSITKAEREHTPPDLCSWLVDVAKIIDPPY